MNGNKHYELLNKVSNKKIVKLKGFNDAILGYDLYNEKLIYSTKKIIKILSNKKQYAEDYFYEEMFEKYKSDSSIILCEDYLINKEFKNEKFCKNE
jgi:hypothetical protein